MKFVFLHVTSSKEKWCEDATQIYLQKLKHFVSIEIVALSSKKLSRAEASTKLTLETEELLQFLQPDDFVVLFDEKGKSLDSLEFSELVQKALMSGKKRCVWIIGGAFGVGEELKKRALVKLSLAPFVMNHQVAQIVALEQIYRSFTILKNLPYHNK